MINNIKAISILFFLLLTTLVYAQEKGSVFLSVFPKDAVIKLNDTLLKSHETYSLDTGNYTIKMWTPTREYVERNITIKPNQTTRLHEVLSYSTDYKAYQKKKRMYNIEMILTRYVPPMIITGVIINTFSIKKSINEELNLANQTKDKYENEFNKDLVLQYKSEYNFHKAEYEKNIDNYNKNLIIGGAIILASATLEYLSFKLKKPEYKEKVLLSSFGLNNYNNKLSPSISLTYKFN
tara:strand:+ start:1240 stop:1950 length:711 start_codon:yes stop_codon:yes gene_type:complete